MSSSTVIEPIIIPISALKLKSVTKWLKSLFASLFEIATV